MELTEIESTVLNIIRNRDKSTSGEIVDIFNKTHTLNLEYIITEDELYFVLNKLMKYKFIKGLNDITYNLRCITYLIF